MLVCLNMCVYSCVNVCLVCDDDVFNPECKFFNEYTFFCRYVCVMCVCVYLRVLVFFLVLKNCCVCVDVVRVCLCVCCMLMLCTSDTNYPHNIQ